MKMIKKYRCFLIGMFMFTFFLLPQHVSASDHTGSLTIYDHGITSHGEDTALSGIHFSIFKVGEEKKHGWQLTEAFAQADIDLNDMSASGQKRNADKLYAWIIDKNMTGKTGVTGKDGKVVFPDLEDGLYLCFAADDMHEAGDIFHSGPFLVFMPSLDEEGNEIYDVLVEPKNEIIEEEKPDEEKPLIENVITGDHRSIFPYLALVIGSTFILYRIMKQ